MQLPTITTTKSFIIMIMFANHNPEDKPALLALIRLAQERFVDNNAILTAHYSETIVTAVQHTQRSTNWLGFYCLQQVINAV